MRHKTKWTATHATAKGVMYFETEQQAKTFCMMNSGWNYREPIYHD